MGEEAPVKTSVSVGMASTEGTVPKKKEVSAAIDFPMKGFFDGVDIITEAMAFATVAAIREVLAEALVPLLGLVFAEEGVFIGKKVIGESTPFFAEFFTPSKGDDPLLVT